MRYRFLLLTLAVLIVGCDSDPAPTVPPTLTQPVVKSLADISLRAGPGYNFDETAQALKGSPVTLLGSARGRNCEDWVLVRTSAGEEGWVVPLLVNVDINKSVLPSAPTPTLAAPVPVTCSADLALLQIDNSIGKALEVYMAGPEPGFTLSIDDGATRSVCLTPGEYCYDLTDGEKHETGDLFFAGGECTC